MTTIATTARPVDPDRLQAFLGRMVGDVGAALSAGLVLLGDRLGLYRALADAGPVTAAELADLTGTSIHYLKPWLANQAAGGYVDYDPHDQSWSLQPEQAAALVDSESPAFFAASMQLAVATLRRRRRDRGTFPYRGGVRLA